MRLCAICLALLAAQLTLSCGHSPGYEPDTAGEVSQIQPPDNRPYELSAALSEGTLHTLDLTFNASMDATTVDVIVTDEDGNNIPHFSDWSDDQYLMHIRGPFAWCTKYMVTIRAGAADAVGDLWSEDTDLAITLPGNPLDINKGSACTADAAISPIFTTSADAGLFLGETIEATDMIEEVYRAIVDTAGVWYVDGSGSFEGANRMVRVPAYTSTGDTAVEKLFWKQKLGSTGKVVSTTFTLKIWDSYNPVAETATTELVYGAGGAASLLLGPYDAGDLNGDGLHETLLSEQTSFGTGDLRQYVFILPGDMPAGRAALIDSTALQLPMGLLGEKLEPFVPIGDVNGDGKADLAAIHYKGTRGGTTSDWQVWVAYGDRDFDMMFYGAGIAKVTGYSSKEIMDVEGGDLDGDGLWDLIVTEMKRSSDNTGKIYVSPYVKIFLGKTGSLSGRRMAYADSQIILDTTHMTYANTRVLGDINGDGLEDLGIQVEVADGKGGIASKSIYIIYGGTTWKSKMYLASTLIVDWGAKIIVNDYDGVVLQDEYWDAKAGDLDNDGYDDFMIRTDAVDGFDVFWFLGEDALTGAGKVLHPSDAAAEWHVEVP